MSNYRRLRVPGGTYFFTLRLQDQRSDLLVTHIGVLRDATRLCQRRYPFAIDAAVVLPAKLHMIWTLPDGDAEFSKRWRLIKTAFSRHVPTPDYVPQSHARRGQKGIWQRGFWDHLIKDEADLLVHQHLIRSAPIHAGLARRVGEWPYASDAGRLSTGPRTIVPVPSSQGPSVAPMSSQTGPIAASEMS